MKMLNAVTLKQEMEEKMAKNHWYKHIHHVKPVGERITHQKDVGKALVLIYVLREPDLTTKQMMPQVMKEQPRKQIILKRLPQANQT